nr:hypothetical protein [Tanacetum cinerariifolium]
ATVEQPPCKDPQMEYSKIVPQSEQKYSGKSEVPTVQGVSTVSAQVSIDGTDVVAASLSYDIVCVFIATQPNGSQIKYEDISQIDDDDIEEMDIKWNLALLSMRADRFWKKTGKKITIQGSDVVGFDKSKVECFNCHKMGHFARECRLPRSQDRGKRESYKKDPKVEEPAPEAMIAIDVEARLVEFKENKIKYCEKIRFIERDIELKDNKIEYLRNELEEVKKEKESIDFKIENFENASKDLDRLLKSQKLDKDKKGMGFNEYCVVLPPPTQLYLPPKKDLSWIYLSLLMTLGSSDNVVSKPMIKFVKESGCPNATKVNNTEYARKPTVKYVEMYKNTSQSPRVKGNQRNWNNQKSQQDNTNDKEYWDSGCYRHMTSNISYLSEYEPFNEGCVSFGHERGNITGKGSIKTGKLEFENIYFVEELKYNMFSVSQICDNKNSVMFTDTECLVLGKDFKLVDDKHMLLITPRQQNMYTIDLKNVVPPKNLTCLIAKALVDESMLWHRRLGHLNFKTMKKLVRSNLVKVVTGDFSRFSRTFFLKSKDETSRILRNFTTEIENLKGLNVKIIKSDNKGKFRNKEMHEFCSRKGIKREFSNARTPQQNGVAERRNRTLIEAARTMLANAKLPDTFWAKAVNTACYVQNRVLVIKPHNKTPMKQVNTKGDEGYFVGYSLSSKAFRGFNKRTKKIEENLHVDFLKNKSIEKGTRSSSTNILGTKEYVHQAVKEKESPLRFISLLNWFHEVQMATSNAGAIKDDAIPVNNASQQEQQEVNRDKEVPKSSGNSNPIASTKFSTNDSFELALSSTVETEVPTVSSPVPTDSLSVPLVSLSVPRIISRGRSSFPEPLSLGNDMSFEKRLEDFFGDTSNAVSFNEVEADLSNMETTIQEEGIDYDEVFAPVARIEAIRLFLAYASYMGFTVYQMDAKSAFLYGTIDEEVYVMQPSGFQDPELPHRVYKVEKAMYGLHQALRDSDYGGANQDRKSTTEGCQFLGRRLISWQCKKQTIVAPSTTKAEYVAAASGCRQVLWIQNPLLDYGSDSKQRTREFMHIYLASCLSPKSTSFNEFSSNIATALVCLATNKTYNFSKMVFDGKTLLRPLSCPHEALPMITSLGGGEGREDLLVGDTMKDSDKSADKGSDSTDEMSNVLGTLGATNILASGGLKSVFTTASLSVATASTGVSPVVATASGSFPTVVIFTTTSFTTPTTRVIISSRGVVIGSSSPIYVNIPSISKNDKGKGKTT